MDSPASAPPSAADQRGRRAGELQAGLLAGLVHGRQRRAGQSPARRRARRTSDTPAAVRAATTIRLAMWPSMTNILWPFEHPAVARLGGGQLDPAEVPLAVVLGDGQGGDGLARGDAGQVALLGLVVARGRAARWRQRHRGEERRAQQRGAHLLEHDDQLDVGEARAAELLGDGERLQAELVGHLAPHGRVVALGGVHEPAHLGLGRLLGQEPADRGAQLFLLVTEGEVHARAPLPLPPAAQPAVFSLLRVGVYHSGTEADQTPGRLCHAGGMGQLEEIWSDATAEVHQIVVGPDGQQRLRPPLPPHGRRHAHRCRQRARGAARDLPEPGREPGGGDPRALGPHPGRARRARGRHLGGRDQRRRRHAAQLRPHPRGRRQLLAWATCGSRRWPPRATRPARSASPSRARTSCSPATPSSPAAPATPPWRAGTSPPSFESIDRRIFAAFDADTLVLPGHGSSTTVGTESPHLEEWVDRGW